VVPLSGEARVRGVETEGVSNGKRGKQRGRIDRNEEVVADGELLDGGVTGLHIIGGDAEFVLQQSADAIAEDEEGFFEETA